MRIPAFLRSLKSLDSRHTPFDAMGMSSDTRHQPPWYRAAWLNLLAFLRRINERGTPPVHPPLPAPHQTHGSLHVTPAAKRVLKFPNGSEIYFSSSDEPDMFGSVMDVHSFSAGTPEQKERDRLQEFPLLKRFYTDEARAVLFPCQPPDLADPSKETVHSSIENEKWDQFLFPNDSTMAVEKENTLKEGEGGGGGISAWPVDYSSPWETAPLKKGILPLLP
jgi:hypothetical protein